MIDPSASTRPSGRTTNAVSAAEDVYLCKVYEDVVVLDLNADEYLCLMDAGAWIHPAPDGCIVIGPDGAAEDLMAAGIAVPQSASHLRRASKTPTLELVPSPRTSMIERLWAALQILEATHVFRRKTLKQLVATAIRPPAFRGRSTTSAQVFGAYKGAVSWVPGEGECLQRAFILKRVLAGRGIHADWVFGVRTWPFGAHCWLQIDDMVVGDTLARVSNYTPIMVV
ncbi:lasso peptide biosynthesis B2 protein [Brevundimonas sp.]|uniref:lasso peptide biosynthesis B2 protein n=1 Tax=Brevundimonas sp. TaxID=1871086 RepID=UPI003B00DC7A